VVYQKQQARRLSEEELEELSQKIVEIVERELEEKSKDKAIDDIIVHVNIAEDWPPSIEVEVEFRGRYALHKKEVVHEILDKVFRYVDEYMGSKGYEVSLNVKA